MAVPTGRESDKFMLRLPDGMRDRIKGAAEVNNRSMNAEIVATLEEKYPPFRQEQLLAAVLSSLKDLPTEYQDAISSKVRKILGNYKFYAPDGSIIDPKAPERCERWDGLGNSGCSDGYGDGNGAYGDSDGSGDGMGGAADSGERSKS